MIARLARWLEALADRIADRIADRFLNHLVEREARFRCDPDHKIWWHPIMTSQPFVWGCAYCGRRWPAVRFDQ